MKQYNYIYKITNLINGKIYIGKHSTDRLDDGYMGSSRTLKLEFSAVGKQHFEKEVLAFSNDENELADLERYYITALNATDPDVGYNRQINSSRYSYTEERNQKISKAKKGTKMSVETRRKMSEALKGKTPINKGVSMSEDQKRKLSEAHKGKTPWNKGKKGLQQAWNKGLKLKKESQI